MSKKKRNKGRFINWQKTFEVPTTQDYSQERSPYWEHLDSTGERDAENMVREPARANPDVISDEVLKAPPENQTRKLLLEIVRTAKFSKGEKAVLNCIGIQGFTEEKTAEILGLSRRSVRTLFLRAQRKCEKLFVAKTRDSSVYSEEQ